MITLFTLARPESPYGLKTFLRLPRLQGDMGLLSIFLVPYRDLEPKACQDKEGLLGHTRGHSAPIGDYQELLALIGVPRLLWVGSFETLAQRT